MKEVVCVNVGQSGIQLANATWELFCNEHGIQANGMLRESLLDDDSIAFKTFFQETPTGQFVPRVVSVDLEPTVIDEVRTGTYRNLFHPDQLISGYEDAANNFARGRFTLGKSMVRQTMNTIRKSVECCEYLQNFFLLNSLGGGTGSGFTSLLLEQMALEYSNRYRVLLSVCISPVLATSVVEPYNAVLSTHSSMNFTDMALVSDNESLYAICQDALDISRPTYSNLNRLIALNFSDLTVSVRFESTLSADIDQLATNLIPYPRIHFVVMAHAPNLSESRAKHQTLSTAEITRMVFNRGCLLVTCDNTAGKYMACCLQFRGDVATKDVNNSLNEIRRRSDLCFVDWCPTGFKLGINSQPPVAVRGSEIAQTNRAVSLIANTSAISEVWAETNQKFDSLLERRAFVHWFVGEGMEEGELNEARENLICLVADYDEVAEVVTSYLMKEGSIRRSRDTQSRNLSITQISDQPAQSVGVEMFDVKAISFGRIEEKSDEDDEEEDKEEEEAEDNEEEEEDKEEEETESSDFNWARSMSKESNESIQSTESSS